MIHGSLGMINGMQVLAAPHLPRFKTVQFRFPKTKKKRIAKKWRKDSTNFRQVPCREMYVLNGSTLLVHPDDLGKFKHMIVPHPNIGMHS